jgi:hypothetical protein
MTITDLSIENRGKIILAKAFRNPSVAVIRLPNPGRQRQKVQ